MAGFNIGSIFGSLIPGLEKGIKSGIQYDIDFARYELKALTTGDKALQDDLNAVKSAWLKEAADEAGVIKGNIANAILGGGDPFAGSRHLMQALEKKHGKP